MITLNVFVCVFCCQGGFYEEAAVFSGSFWSQADPQASLGPNPRARVNKPLTPPPPPSQNLSSQV